MGVFVLLFSVVVYLVFFAAFLYLVVFVGGDIMAFAGAPKTVDYGASVFGAVPPALVNMGLLVLFGLQHSIMARASFKNRLTRIVPPAMERSVYVLATVAVLALLYAGWTPMPETVWLLTSPLWSAVMTGIFVLGFGLVLLSTFLISHFELFGLAQGWRAYRKTEPAPPAFRTPVLYRYVRHPLYLGFLMAFWATPHMTVGHLLFAAVWSAYIFVAIGYEERDLLAQFGETYREYMARTPAILPFGRRR